MVGKSSFENNVSGSDPSKLPRLDPSMETALDFEGDQRLSEVTRLGLPADPDLMIFAVTQIDENNSGVDTVLKIGSDVGGTTISCLLPVLKDGHGDLILQTKKQLHLPTHLQQLPKRGYRFGKTCSSS